MGDRVGPNGNAVTVLSLSLAEKVKLLQRNNSEAKEQWIAFTDKHLNGRRDPNNQSAESLQAFLTQYEAGVRLVLYEDADHVDDIIRMMLRQSPNWEKLWNTYCVQFGDGKCMVEQHPLAFHVKFLDNVAEKANRMATPMPNAVISPDPRFTQEPPLKKFKADAGEKPPDPLRDRLVVRIKQFQRQGDENREIWKSFCESNLASVMDPARHEAPVLQHFIDKFRIPEASADGGLPPIVMDAEKAVIVQKVKEFQRWGEQQRDAWYSFCGFKRDPARHETDKLREFCSAHGIEV